MDWHGPGTASANQQMQSIPAPDTPIPAKLLEQLGGKVFTRMFNYFNAGPETYAFVVGKGSNHYRLSAEEALPLHRLSVFVKDEFIEEYRRRAPAVNMHGMILGVADEAASHILVYYRTGVRLSIGPSGEGLPPILRAAFPQAAGRTAMIVFVHVFVDYQRKQLVFHFQGIAGDLEGTAASRAAIEFAGVCEFVTPLRTCLGCLENMPITKKCPICFGPFCDAECFKGNWKQHKTTCIPHPRPSGGAPSAQLREAAVCPCGQIDARLRCGRCNTRWFCSRECQVAVWPFHKNVCVPKPQ